MKLRFAVKTHHWIHILNCTHCTLFWFYLFLSFHFLLWLWADVFFSISLYLTPGGLKQAIHAVCVCHNQLQFQQRPEQPRHLSSSTPLSWNPIHFLSPLTHSYSSCMTLADRSYLGSFLPSLQLAYLIYLCSSLMPFSKSCCLALFWTVCHALFLVQDSGNCMGSVWCFKRVNRSFCDIRIKAQFLFLMWWFNVKRDK